MIKKLPILHHLDLSDNYNLCGLSPRLLNMPALRQLNLHGWLDYWNIPAMKNLIQLEELTLRKRMNYNGTDSAASIKEALPNCKVICLP